MFKGKQIFDITRKIVNDMTIWPGDAKVTIWQTSTIKEGSVANVSRVDMGVHSGTHMDAPRHFIEGGGDIASLDIGTLIGRVVIVETEDEAIDETVVSRYDLESVNAVFFKTRASMRDEKSPFWNEYPAITEGCAKYLIDRGIRTIGTDYFSIEYCTDNRFPVHKLLLSNGVAIIENLSLKDIEPVEYDFICLPLMLEGSDGSPVRALLFK